MNFQVQALVHRQTHSKEDVDLDLFAGVVAPLSSPFNLYFRVSDLERGRDQIYFYAYSLGKDRIVLWGVYDESVNEFLIDDACRWTRELNDVLASLRQHDYTFQFTAVRNQITSRANQFTVFKNPKVFQADVAEFKANGFKANGFKANGFKANGFKATKQNVDLMINYGLAIEKHFKDEVKRVILDHLNIDELEDNVLNDMFAILHAIVFTYDYQDYKVVKYMVSGFEDRVASSFMFKYLTEIALATSSIYDVDQKHFIMILAQELVDQYEAVINRHDIGVIGDRSTDRMSSLQAKLEMISTFFEKFISKSIYSRSFYIDKLAKCPPKEDCEDCDLYQHGGKKSSKYDLT